MKIEYLHASKFGNGAMVAAEFKKLMAAKGVSVEVHHIREVSPAELSPADLYVFSSPGRLGKPIGRMRRFLKKVRLPAGTKYAVLTTEAAPKPDKKTGRMPTEEELAKWQRVRPIMNEILQGKGLVKVAEDKVFVTGLKAVCGSRLQWPEAGCRRKGDRSLLRRTAPRRMMEIWMGEAMTVRSPVHEALRRQIAAHRRSGLCHHNQRNRSPRNTPIGSVAVNSRLVVNWAKSTCQRNSSTPARTYPTRTTPGIPIIKTDPIPPHLEQLVKRAMRDLPDPRAPPPRDPLTTMTRVQASQSIASRGVSRAYAPPGALPPRRDTGRVRL